MMSREDQVRDCQTYLDQRTTPSEWTDKCYQAVIRQFKNGDIEVCTKVIRPMQRMAQSKNWLEHYPIRPKRKEAAVEVTADQEAKKRKENIDRAVRRARQHVRWHVKSIGADHLLTLTYRTGDDCPMDDLERLKADWQRFVRLMRHGLPASGKYRKHHGLKHWQFVAIREKQDNGAYHLHVAVVGRQDITLIRRCWYVAIGGNQDDEGEDTKGQINVRGPSKRFGVHTSEWKAAKLSGYMTKYLHKAFEELEANGSKRYWASKSNDKVEPERIWLAASSFVDAIIETHAIASVRLNGQWMNLWASDGWDVVWAAGPSECK